MMILHRIHNIFLLTGILLTILRSVVGKTTCTTVGNICYEITNKKKSYQKSMSKCTLRPAILDTSAKQNAFYSGMNDQFPEDKIWIGAKRSGGETSPFIWMKSDTDQPFLTWTNWESNTAPDKDKDCVFLDKSKGGEWLGDDCDAKYHMACEEEETTTTTSTTPTTTTTTSTTSTPPTTTTTSTTSTTPPTTTASTTPTTTTSTTSTPPTTTTTSTTSTTPPTTTTSTTSTTPPTTTTSTTSTTPPTTTTSTTSTIPPTTTTSTTSTTPPTTTTSTTPPTTTASTTPTTTTSTTSTTPTTTISTTPSTTKTSTTSTTTATTTTTSSSIVVPSTATTVAPTTDTVSSTVVTSTDAESITPIISSTASTGTTTRPTTPDTINVSTESTTVTTTKVGTGTRSSTLTTATVATTGGSNTANVPSKMTQCPEIHVDEHTRVIVWSREIMGQANIYCDPEYSFQDGSKTRSILCLSNLQWSSEIPKCQYIRCTNPKVVANCTTNSHATETFSNGENLTYTCRNGMRMRDGSAHKIVYCSSTGWTDSVSDCSDMRCPPVPIIMNSTFFPVETGIGSQVNVTCFNAHVFYGFVTSQIITCQQNKTWTPILPHCSPVTCPPIVSPRNGVVNSTIQRFGTVISIKCNLGFVFPDNSSFMETTCQLDKIWNKKVENCSIVKCPPAPVIANAVRSGSGIIYGSKFTYTCNTGFLLNDGKPSRTITCTENFVWSSNGFDCRDGRCTPVQQVPNANPSTTDTDRFTTVTFTCHRGHRFVGGTEVTKQVACQSNGQWDSILPECEVLKCPKPQSVPNATVSVNEPLPYNTSVVNYCIPGHKFSDKSSSIGINCTDTAPGQVAWMPDITGESCHPLYCPPLPEIENVTKSSEDTIYDTVVKLECPSGFEFKRKQPIDYVRCTEDGSWDHNVTQCIPAFCPELPVWDDSIFNTTRRDHLTVVEYRCPSGSKFADKSQSKIAVCNDIMVWEPRIEACEPNEGIADDIKKNKKEAQGSTSIGTVAMVLVVLICSFVIVIDVATVFSHLKIAKQNVKDFIRTCKKLYDSYRMRRSKVVPTKKAC